MKTIRYFAALLLILTGALHALTFFNASQDPNALLMLSFGIIYIIIGILLILNLKISAALGIVFPLTGIGAGVFVMGLKNFDTRLGILGVIDIIVVICCVVLFLHRKK